LLEIAVDGTGLQQVISDPFPYLDRGFGAGWTHDGKYYFFTPGQVVVLPGTSGFLTSEPRRIQLTTSPLILQGTTLSKDGKKVFVVGYNRRGELSRYDMKSRQFQPFMGGISAEFSAFSKDGQWVTYVSYPEGTLWRSRVDGSDRLQLTSAPDKAVLPRWSPDGKRIAFFEAWDDKPWRVFVISADGGTPQELLPESSMSQADPNWSPDGGRILFGGTNDASSTLHILDLTTHQVQTLPGSQQIFSPRWSPDGNYVAAISADSSRLMLFDIRTQRWKELASGMHFGWMEWSKTGQYLIYWDNGAVSRLHIGDGKKETIVDLKNFVPAGLWDGSLTLAPDDSPLLLRNVGTHDVYSLDWHQP
jgi:WD40 repeat protein